MYIFAVHGIFHVFFSSDLSAFLRRIDLVTNLAAPILTGQIITYGSSVIGAVFLGAWNLAFMFLEYGLLYAIYVRVPGLAFKKSQEGRYHQMFILLMYEIMIHM